jgi:hypothetical protein
MPERRIGQRATRAALAIGVLCAGSATTLGQTAATTTDWYARNTTRVESWRFFEPPPGGGDPTSTYIGNRLQFGFRRVAPRIDLQAAGQFVQLGWLPEHATGPGPLGLGAVYFDHAGTAHPGEVYLKYLNVRFKEVTPGLAVQVGRFAYTSGAEAESGVPKVDAVKRLRIDSRLVGEFEFSFFQRSFDGIRADYSRSGARATVAAFFPTQGGFEEDANRTMGDVIVLTGAATFRPGAPLPYTEWQIFSHRYDDERAVSGRPDNSGITAPAADVHVTTLGTTLIASRKAGRGEFDAVAWLAFQTGRWYDLHHRADALSLEAGYQWTTARARPWVRAGWLRASGDRDPSDRRHETFFQMLPTVRRHALSATYSQMNLRDLFVEVLATPAPRIATRAEWHRLTLDRPTDRWYFGSGATQRAGRVFGFATRSSGGATGLGNVIEGSVDVRVLPRWTLGGYLGAIRGGDVISRTFAGRALLFGFIESTLQF